MAGSYSGLAAPAESAHDPESIREAKLPQSILKYFTRLLVTNGVLFLSLGRAEAKLLTFYNAQFISHRNFLLKHHLTYLTTRMRRLNPYLVNLKVKSYSSSRKQNASNIKPTLLAKRHIGMLIVVSDGRGGRGTHSYARS